MVLVILLLEIVVLRLIERLISTGASPIASTASMCLLLLLIWNNGWRCMVVLIVHETSVIGGGSCLYCLLCCCVIGCNVIVIVLLLETGVQYVGVAWLIDHTLVAVRRVRFNVVVAEWDVISLGVHKIVVIAWLLSIRVTGCQDLLLNLACNLRRLLIA